MDQIFAVVMVGLVFAFLGGGIAGWIAISQIGALRRTIQRLELQVAGLVARTAASQGREDRDVADDSERSASSESLSAPPPVETPAPQSVPPRPVAQAAPARSAPKATPRPLPRPRPQAARKPRQPLDLETLLGAKGSVWIGGIALLLGAVFLLRYTIEAGLLTPIMRLALTTLLGVVALGASELFARRDLKNPAAKALAQKADIPALLAAVGVFALFGTVYAAHALYGMLSTLPAFIGMAAVALGTMALSLRRGPWLAAIGLVGALAVPLLVASVTPSYIGVFAYVGLIVAAAIWVARRQGWSWLGAAALAGATAWLWVLFGKATDPIQFALWSAGIVTVATLTFRAIVQARPSQDGGSIDVYRFWMSAAWIGLLIQLAIGMAAGDGLMPLSFLLPFCLIGWAIVISWRETVWTIWPFLAVVGGFFAMNFAFSLYPEASDFVGPYDLVGATLYLPIGYGLAAGAIALAVIRQANRIDRDTVRTPMILAGGFAAYAMLYLGLDYLSVAALGWKSVTALFALATLFFTAASLHRTVGVMRGALWTFAILWALTLFVLMDLRGPRAGDVLELYTVLAVAAAVPVMAVARWRNDLWLRLSGLLLPAFAGLVAIDAVDLSETQVAATPIVNELWLFFGLPALACTGGALWMERKRSDLASQALRGGAVVFGLLLVVLLIHHAMNGGDLRADVGFESLAVQLLVAFAALLGGSWVSGDLARWPDRKLDTPGDLGPFIVPALLIAVSIVSLGLFALLQLLAFNPLFNGATRIDGPPVFNALLLGYLLPAVLLGVSALRYAGTRPAWFVRTLAGLAGLAWIAWTTAQIRVFAQGPHIEMGAVPWASGELYAVSAVWLLTGLAVLGAGSLTKRRDLRLASAVIITLTVLKVFLVDMSALDGALRALSFIGLGVALIGIGRLYQRVLTAPTATNDMKVSVD